MSSELDVSFDQNAVGLVVALDGRESLTVPAFRIAAGGPITRFKPMISGPVLVMNAGDAQITVKVAQSEEWEQVARWMNGNWIAEESELTIEASKAEAISPKRTYVGLKVTSVGSAVARPVGILSRGPSSMPAPSSIPVFDLG